MASIAADEQELALRMLQQHRSALKRKLKPSAVNKNSGMRMAAWLQISKKAIPFECRQNNNKKKSLKMRNLFCLYKYSVSVCNQKAHHRREAAFHFCFFSNQS